MKHKTIILTMLVSAFAALAVFSQNKAQNIEPGKTAYLMIDDKEYKLEINKTEKIKSQFKNARLVR